MEDQLAATDHRRGAGAIFAVSEPDNELVPINQISEDRRRQAPSQAVSGQCPRAVTVGAGAASRRRAQHEDRGGGKQSASVVCGQR
jgi:hypothetical protein